MIRRNFYLAATAAAALWVGSAGAVLAQPSKMTTASDVTAAATELTITPRGSGQNNGYFSAIFVPGGRNLPASSVLPRNGRSLFNNLPWDTTSNGWAVAYWSFRMSGDYTGTRVPIPRTITGLMPNTRYRVFLQEYRSNNGNPINNRRSNFHIYTLPATPTGHAATPAATKVSLLSGSNVGADSKRKYNLFTAEKTTKAEQIAASGAGYKTKGERPNGANFEITGLDASTPYYLYIYDEGETSGLASDVLPITFTTTAAPSPGLAVPTYTVSGTHASHNSIRLTGGGSSLPAGVDARNVFYLASTPFPSSTTPSDVGSVSGVRSFRLTRSFNEFDLGANNFRQTRGGTLMANTKYYVAVRDRKGSGRRAQYSPLNKIDGCTRPLAPPTVTLTTTHNSATTDQNLSTTDDDEIHVLVVEGTSVDSSVTGTQVENTGLGANKTVGGSSSVTVVAKTSFSASTSASKLVINSGLSPNKDYVLYYVRKGASTHDCMLYSTVRGVTFKTKVGGPAKPSYTVGRADATKSTISVSGSAIAGSNVRWVFYNAGAISQNTYTALDGAAMAGRISSFVTTSRNFNLGDGAHGAALTPNTGYTIVLIDSTPGPSGTPSAPSDRRPGYTRPREVSIAAPTGVDLTHEKATTASVTVSARTAIHWMVVERSDVRLTGLTGRLLQSATKGGTVATQSVVSAGEHTSTGKIDLWGDGLKPGTDYALYYAVESTLSRATNFSGDPVPGTGLFADLDTSTNGLQEVAGVTFRVPQNKPLKVIGYRADESAATASSVSFSHGSSLTRGDTRWVFYHTSTITDTSMTDLDAAVDGGRIKSMRVSGGFTLSSLMPNQQYHVRVKDVRGGLESDVSDEFTAWTKPDAPAGITLTSTRPDETDGTKARVWFSKATKVVGGTHRIFYASTGALNTGSHPSGWDGTHFDTRHSAGQLNSRYAASDANSDEGVEFPKGATLLDANRQYHFYAVDYNMSTGFQSLPFYVGGKALYTAPKTSDVAVPTLTRKDSDTTHEKIIVTASTILADYTRAYYFSENDLSHYSEGGSAEGYFDAPGGTVVSFSDPGPSGSSDVSIQGSARGDIDVTLSPNTKYYIRARDYRTAQSTASTQLSANKVVYTRPAAITDLTVSSANDPRGGITATVDITSQVGTAVHWILTSSDVDHSAYTGTANVKEATVSATVLKKGTADGTGSAATVSLHDNLHGDVELAAEREYGFYYAVEGKESTLYADLDAAAGIQEVKEVTFTVSAVAPPAPVYTVNDDEATDDSIKLESADAIDGKRYVFYSTSDLSSLDHFNKLDAAAYDPDQAVETFETMTKDFDLGDGTTGDALDANRLYNVRTVDINGGRISSPGAQASGWTKPSAPAGYEVAETDATSVTFFDGGDLPEGLERRFYVSETSGLNADGLEVDAVGEMSGGPASIEGTAGLTAAKKVTFENLTAGTEYFFYFVDVGAMSGLLSEPLETDGITPAAPSDVAPVSAYVGGDATDETVELTGGPALANEARRLFFYSTDQINADGTVDMAGVPVETFVIEGPENAPHTFTLGDGTTGDALEANTEYYVRFKNSTAADPYSYGALSADDFTVWTAPEAPSGYTESENDRTATSVTFTGGSDVDDHIIRRFYASTEENLGFLMDGRADQAGVTVVEAEAVDRSDPDADGVPDADAAEEVTFTGLTEEVEYYFYFVDYNPESELYADSKEGPITPASAAPEKPEVYDQDLDHEGTTAATIRFADGDAIPRGAMRKVFYDDEPIAIVLESGMDKVGGTVKTFTMERPADSSDDHAFTLGERPYVDLTGGFEALEANTKYYLRVQDSRGAAKDSDHSDEFTGWTAPEAPDGYVPTSIGATNVMFEGGGSVPEGVVRRFYASDSNMLGLHGDGAAVDPSDAAAMGEVDNTDPVSPMPGDGAFDFTGLTTGTKYYFYFVDYNPESGLLAEYKVGPYTPEADAVLPPVYAVGHNMRITTDETIPLTQGGDTDDASATLVRHFFVNADAPLSLDGTDAATLDETTSTFSVMDEGEIVLGDEKGAGDDRGDGVGGADDEEDNAALSPNTQYYIYVRDYRPVDGSTPAKWSDPYDVTRGEGSWTLPDTVDPMEPTEDPVTPRMATTEVMVAPNTAVHWVLLQEETPAVKALTGADVKHAVVGEDIADDDARTVVNAGTVENEDDAAATETLMLHEHEDLDGLALGDYVLYYAVEGLGSGLYANYAASGVEQLKGVGFTVVAAAPDTPEYSVKTAEVTATTIPLMQDPGTADATPTLVRRFFVNGTALDLDTDAKRDGIVSGATTTFTVNSDGDVTIGDGKGGGNTPNADNAALMANTKYYIYVTDYDASPGVGLVSATAHKVTGDDGEWTLPAALAEPTVGNGNNANPTNATTSSITVAPDTEVHWVLLKEPKSISGLTGSDIKSTAKGSEIVSGRTVVNEGTLPANGTIDLHDGATLALGVHTLYYVVEGETSEKFTDVAAVQFNVEPVMPPNAPVYSVKTAEVTATTIPLMQRKPGTADATPTLIRRFFVNKTPLDLDTDAKRDGVGLGATTTFTVNGSGDVTIGDSKGGGDTANTDNAALEANTKYYVYVTDYNSDNNLVSTTAHKVTGDDGEWTLPAALTAPTVSDPTVSSATTSSITVAPNTEVHWVLLKESESTSGLTGANIKSTAKGSAIATGRTVINKGKLTTAGTIDLHDGVTLTAEVHTLYYVVEGAISDSAVTNKFTAVAAVQFTVGGGGGGVTPDPAYTADTDDVTETTIPVTKSSGPDASATLVRTFHVNEGATLETEDTATSKFSVNTGGKVVIGDLKGAGDDRSSAPANAANVALKANKKYFLYVQDGEGSRLLVTTADTGDDDGVWTLPASAPMKISDKDLSDGLVKTDRVTVSGDTRLHWVLVEGTEVDITGLTGAGIKDAKKGDGKTIGKKTGLTVVNESSLSRTAEVSLHSGLTGDKLAPGSYVLYHVVEGTSSGLYSVVRGLKLTVPGGPDPKVYGSASSGDLVYPNPTSGLLYVPVSDGQLQVYGTDGSSQGSFAVVGGVMDLSSLPSGAYVLRIGDQVVRVVKD